MVKELEVQADITVKIRFKKYASKYENELALKQIQIWLEETLEDDGQIPLFVASQYGEQTTSKVVEVRQQPPKEIQSET